MFSIPKSRWLLLAILCFMTGCANSGGVNQRQILVYTPHGKDLLQDFAQRYESANPGVKVSFVDMGSREVLERVRAERNRPQADVWWGASNLTFQDAADDKLLTAYKPTWAERVAADSHDKNDFWYGTYETPEVIAFNSDVLNAETAPHDWDEVLDEKWRDKILLRNPIPSDSMRVIFGALIERQNDSQKGFDWLRKLDANVKEYTSDGTLLMQKLARQEGVLTLWNMPDVIIFKQERKLPVDYVFPASGTPVITDGIAIIKGAPHEEEARKFYEFVTSPESLQYAAEKFYRLPVARTDIDKTKLPEWMRQNEFKRINLDWNNLRKNGTEWMQYWDVNIRGRSKN